VGRGKILLDNAAVEQRGKGNAQRTGDLRDLLERGRALAALQTAEMQLGHLEFFSDLFLCETGLAAGETDILANGFIGHDHDEPLRAYQNIHMISRIGGNEHIIKNMIYQIRMCS